MLRKDRLHYNHERFVVELDPSRRFIKGFAELIVHPLVSNLTKTNINCRQCNIENVSVNDIRVDFTYKDVAEELNLGTNTTIAHHQVYKSKYLNALREADEGELSIDLPSNCVKQIGTRTDTSHIITKDDPAEKPPRIEPVFAPITIRIEYTLDDPQNGVVFVQKDDEIAPHRSNHMYTVHQPLPGSTRSWLPCIDSISERCTWDMEFIVPRKEDSTHISEYDGEGSFEEENGMMVVCSGDVIEQALHPTDTTKKIVRYSLSVPTPAPFIGFAVGPFEMIKLSPQQLQEEVLTATDLDENQQQSLMAEINMMCNIYAFGLPGFEEELNVTCSFLMHAMHFYTQEYGSYPFSDYKLVFVQDAWSNIASSASLAICSSRLLHSADIVDQVYQTRRELSQELASQWFGIYIAQKSWADTWLVRGLANYMGSLFIKRHLGNNEYRLRLKKDMELCCMLDINRPPIYHTALPFPLDLQDLEFVELKAPLVIYMLDKRMCKGGGTLGLSRVLPKMLVSAMSGELVQNAISTHYFLRLCRKVSGFDTRVFAEQWVYQSGCPRFSFSFRFNRKKMVVEIFMRQENMDPMGERVAHFFSGNLTVRIHEADGTPYEHILDIQSVEQKFEVQFNTKYKRIRRNTKRFQAKQAAAAAAVVEEEQEHEENGDQTTVLGIIPSLGLGMPLFEEPNQKKEWRIIEWGQDEDASGASSAMFDWIRLDAELEWVCVVDFKQPDYMWAAQLTKDRDVVAQHEAISMLKYMPSEATSTSLLRAVMDPKCFYKIRMEAAYGIASCGVASLNWIGLHQLSKMFYQSYCFPLKSQHDKESLDSLPLLQSIPKPNNFTDISAYYLQKASIVAFSQIRDERGLTPVKIRQFLLDLLRYNDNVGNEFSDCYYVSTLILALGDALIPSSTEEFTLEDPEDEKVNSAAKAEIERFRTLDYVVPSYHNVITTACLKTMTKLMLKELMPINLSLFVQYTRYGNYVEVRLTAFDSIYVLCGLSHPILNRYLLKVMKEDPSVYVSYYVARSMLAWLGLVLKETSDTGKLNTYIEEFAEEEGRVVADDHLPLLQKTPQQIIQTSIENVRKRFESETELQCSLWNLLNSTEKEKLGHCVRKCLLQFCEYVFKPIDVGLKVTIRVPTIQPQSTDEDIQESLISIQKPIIQFSKPKQLTEEKKKKKAKHTLMRAKDESHSEDAQSLHHVPSKPITPVSSPGFIQEPEKIIAIHEDPKPIAINTTPIEPTTNTITLPVKEKQRKVQLCEPDLSLNPTSAPTSKPKLKKISHGSTSEELKKCRRVLNKLNKYDCALPFVQPVDELIDGAPNYYEIIKNPMDLSLIKRRVENKEYTTFRQLEDDIHLMLNNCFTYNGPGTFVYNEGLALEAAFDKEVTNLQHNEFIKPSKPKITETFAISQPVSSPVPMIADVGQPVKIIPPIIPAQPVLPFEPEVSKRPEIPETQLIPTKRSREEVQSPVSNTSEKKTKRRTEYEKMEVIIINAMTNPHAFEFLRPVDPIRQGVPQYFTIIKKPMDLSTIQAKLKNNVYKNPLDMNEDVKLIFKNCYTFNPPDTYVYNEAKLLEESYNQDWKHYFGNYVHSSVSKTKTASIGISDEMPRKLSNKPSNQNTVLPPKPVFNPAMETNNIKKCERIIKKLWAHQASVAFHKPVDAIASGVPHYYDVVKKPMDLSTLQNHFDQDKFQTIWEFERSIRQIFWNCYGFNHFESWVVKQCEALESFFNQIWSAEFADPNCLKGEDKRVAQKIMNKLTYHDCAALFNVPVDLAALPDYAQIIKKPIDLRTIWEDLESGKYTSLKDLDQDIRLVFKNCFTYNNSGTFGYDQGKRLEKHYQKINKDLRARMSGNPPPPAPITVKRPHASNEELEPSAKIRKSFSTPIQRKFP